ncbi:MAG: 8-amino-7-oxononanoate synthase [Candidatus Omnitrophica bacterium]|nr:8-amino-7-oxononanoate synthase [Candidatus Omnitrophota bacterium]MBU4303181.1 8-amino-7-oxononanoate synthase [Candidatus Omnitrophota bacterium]MBU4468128.1 8-amino-7-oxononanoate synthase [Candidatus Omnitrophota bacterium]MCG2708201.1 8-amino-7-oxononanoate synthase [Candidatus Omnitrophota bacterium]
MAGIEEFLKERQEQGLLRKLKPASLRLGGKIYFENKEYVDLSSNDYLGLSAHPELKKAAIAATGKFGVASCASRLLSGDSELFQELEDTVAKFKGKEAGLVFNSGYQANVGIISSLFTGGDCIFSDRLNHASIIDGILLSQAKIFRFQHNDPGHLELLLKKERAKFKNALIITESIFSMDGDRAPLKELVGLKEKYNCQIMVDEAHATGVFGENGSGLVEEEGLSARIDLIMGTFSKALAGFGAYLATSRSIVDYLVNTCRSFIYSTALPPAVIAGNLASLKLIQDEPYRRKKLLSMAKMLRDKLQEKGFCVKGASQIIPLILGDNLRAVEFAKKVQEQGYWALPVRPPTVPAGQARLRLSLSYDHNQETLNKLIDVLSTIRI